MPALDKECFLVELGLNLQIITAQDSLLIVGFLRKRGAEEEAFLLVDPEKGNIVGLNRKCAELTRHKLTGRVVTQQEVQLSTIFSELSLESMGVKDQFDCYLETGLNGELPSLGRLLVRVEVHSCRHYFGKKLVRLVLRESAVNRDSRFMNVSSNCIPSIKVMENNSC